MDAAETDSRNCVDSAYRGELNVDAQDVFTFSEQGAQVSRGETA